jgi:hypothetical protein
MMRSGLALGLCVGFAPGDDWVVAADSGATPLWREGLGALSMLLPDGDGKYNEAVVVGAVVTVAAIAADADVVGGAMRV